MWQSKAEFVNLTELDLSWNKLTSLPLSLGKLAKLKKLTLCGCDSLDFGKLADFINATGIAEIDLSYCNTLIKSPATLAAFLKKIKRIKKLRFATSFSAHLTCLNSSTPLLLLSSVLFLLRTRIYGQPVIMTEVGGDRDDWKAAKKALNDANRSQNSKFALTVIQALNSPAFSAFE